MSRQPAGVPRTDAPPADPGPPRPCAPSCYRRNRDPGRGAGRGRSSNLLEATSGARWDPAAGLPQTAAPLARGGRPGPPGAWGTGLPARPPRCEGAVPFAPAALALGLGPVRPRSAAATRSASGPRHRLRTSRPPPTSPPVALPRSRLVGRAPGRARPLDLLAGHPARGVLELIAVSPIHSSSVLARQSGLIAAPRASPIAPSTSGAP